MNTDNIYNSPNANLESAAPGLNNLPRFSAWWVFLLCVFTLYFYALYWLYSRSKIINEIYPSKLIPEPFMIFTIVFSGGSYLLDLADYYFYLGLHSEAWSTPAAFLSNILTIYWCFSVRNRLKRLFIHLNLDIRIESLVTFLFGPIYLANRINHAKDLYLAIEAPPALN